MNKWKAVLFIFLTLFLPEIILLQVLPTTLFWLVYIFVTVVWGESVRKYDKLIESSWFGKEKKDCAFAHKTEGP
jgi:uncharacterized membrane protein YbaN (DUF454 family)